ncbi:hypothetical protein K1Y72_31010 [Actinomadura sp. PM05-2]|uniref:Uncharacterized protein n=1 Tax=Actinomadura parmotrematis TaxID=2864039 RepID=A0ABS7G3A3_9ACTN|nr:hypothetical protein [Actinomadura parmotrematis]
MHADGDLRASRALFETAYREAERWGDGEAMARAALGLGGLWVHEHRTTAAAATARTRQRTALAAIDPGSALALRLRARLAAEDGHRSGDPAAVLALLAEARRTADPVARADVLGLAHHCLLGPDHGALRLDLATELVGEASRTGRRGDLPTGLLWHACDLFLAGDPHAERSLGELRGLLDRRDHRAARFVLRALETALAVRHGRLADAEALAADCARRGEEAGDAAAAGWYAAQLGTVRWYQGRVAECLAPLTELAASPLLSPHDHACYAGLAVAAAAAGDRRTAEGTLARLRARLRARTPRSGTWLFAACGAAEARDLLAPYAELPAVLCLGAACLGSVRHFLGVAALTLGDAGGAVHHLRRAVDANLALGHWPAAALSRARLGEALALRDGPADAAAGAALARAAREAADLGMAPAARAAGTPVAVERHGKGWRVAAGARAAVVADSVGMRHLAALVANPGRDVPAVVLAAGPAAAGDAPAAPSAQPVLDGEAKRTYRRRLAVLDEEIAGLEAADRHDRAGAARAERDWLVAELAAAAGLGGRTRRFADDAERARTAVGKAIRRALRRIDDADPQLGAELRATVHTGLLCSYRPR